MPPYSAYDVSPAVSFQQSDPVSNKRPLHERRSVTFNESVRVKRTIHVANFSEDEHEAYWCSPYEYRLMKKNIKSEVELLDSGLMLLEANPEFCSRGIEHLTSAGSERRMANKLRGRAVVIEEQALQREEGSDDQLYVAQIYADASAEAVEEARLRALNDQLEVLQ